MYSVLLINVMNAAIVQFVCRDDKIIEATIIDVSTCASTTWSFFINMEGDMTSSDDEWENTATGDIDCKKTDDILYRACKSFKFIFSHGIDKCRYLMENVFNNNLYVFNLQDFNCPSAMYMPHIMGTECLTHAQNMKYLHCSKSLAHRLSNWCRQDLNKINLYETSVRLKTFSHWTDLTIKIEELAKFGFVHIYGNTTCTDNTLCVYCGFQKNTWELTDSPIIEHRKSKNNCMHFLSFEGEDVPY